MKNRLIFESAGGTGIDASTATDALAGKESRDLGPNLCGVAAIPRVPDKLAL